MSDQLFSSHWYRVARLKIALRSHVRVHKHVYRDNTWYILRDESSGRHHRFNETAYCFIRLINGNRTVNEIWELMQDKLGDDAPTQQEVINLLGQLHHADHLLADLAPDVEELIDRRTNERRKLFISRIGNPLAIRIPLLDPDRWLKRWIPLARPLFTKTAAALGLFIMLLALLEMTRHWSMLSKHAVEHALSPYNLMIIWFVYPIVKGIHELGHAFAVKKWGGEVHEMGIMLLVLMPVPYVDASASTSFRSKRQRITVSAAGIVVELLLASIALLLWLNVQEGLVSDVLFNVMLICGVSTLLFNGNPLLRFDGYYVFADAIEIPGLGKRANSYYTYLVQRYLFDVKTIKSPVTADGEVFWFITYGAAAFVYRIFILVMITLYIAGQYFFVGVALALWAIFMQLVLPVLKAIAYLLKNPVLSHRRERALSVSVGAIAFLVAMLFLVPMPLNTMAQGVVWMPEASYVRAGSTGFIQRILVEDGTFVKKGDALIETYDPLMEAQLELHRAKKKELLLRYDALVQQDIVESEITQEEIRVLDGKIQRLQEQITEMTITSPVDGEFIIAESKDLDGHFLKQGDPIAYVIDFDDVSVRVVVPQNAIGLVRKRTRDVEIRLEGMVRQRIHSTVEREIPAATYRLPSKALAQEGGGPIQTDPFDKDGVKTKDQYFQFEVSLPESIGSAHIGQRVYVRFSHGYEPMAWQWYRSFEELFLDELGRV
ncbi:MAG: PqqD family peptide modification chaperone [Thiotrichales bacterium]|nr:MAG: PqqD family peptide modification chaperone [Thiotrichales bacterium]